MQTFDNAVGGVGGIVKLNFVFLFSEFYEERALFDLGVEYNYPANSEAEMLLLLLKELISISAPFSPTRLTS